MRNLIKTRASKLKRILRNFLNSLNISQNFDSELYKGVIIEGDPSMIVLGDGTKIEPGVVLSTKVWWLYFIMSQLFSQTWRYDYDIWR